MYVQSRPTDTGEDNRLQEALELIYNRLPEANGYLTLGGGHEIVGKVAIIAVSQLGSEDELLQLNGQIDRFDLCPLCGKETKDQSRSKEVSKPRIRQSSGTRSSRVDGDGASAKHPSAGSKIHLARSRKKSVARKIRT